MPWQFPWPESIKQRLCRYLLQHYLGHYFEEKISLKQLTIDIYNGTVQLENINLDCDALNEQLKTLNLPFEILNGYVGNIYVYIPWHDLLNDSCRLEIKNLNVTLRPRKSSDDDDEFHEFFGTKSPSSASDMFSSVFLNSMQTSMQIAQECLKDDFNINFDNDDDDHLISAINANNNGGGGTASGTSGVGSSGTNNLGSLVGLEAFARTIDSVLARVKITIEHIKLRIEHVIEQNSSGYSNGIALEFHLKAIKYYDLDTAKQNPTTQTSTSSNNNNDNSSSSSSTQNSTPINRPAIAIKNFIIEGLTAYCDEFLIKEDQQQQQQQQQQAHLDQSMLMTNSIYINPNDLNSKSLLFQKQGSANTPSFQYIYTQPMICATFSGIQEIQVCIKQPSLNDFTNPQQNTQNQTGTTAKLEVNAQFGAIKCFLCPKQIHLLTEMLTALSGTQSGSSYGATGESEQAQNDMNLSEPLYPEAKDEAEHNKMKLIDDNSNLKQKPIRGCDQQKFETLLQNDLLTICGKNKPTSNNQFILETGGMGDADIDDDSDEEFHLASASTKSRPTSTAATTSNQRAGTLNTGFGGGQLSSSDDDDDEKEIDLTDNDDPTKFKQQSKSQQQQQQQQQQQTNTSSDCDKLAERIKQISSDPSLELFIYKIKFTMFSLTVLTKDPVADSSNKMLGDFMKETSEKYFDYVSSINTSGVCKDFSDIRKQFFEACAQQDHLLLMCKPINLQFIQKLEKDYLTLTDLTCSIGYLECVEYLYTSSPSSTPQPGSSLKQTKATIVHQTIISELIKFEQSAEACVKLKYVAYEPNVNHMRNRYRNRNLKRKSIKYPKEPYKQLTLSLNRIECEIDVSIVDRLYYLLNNPIDSQQTVKQQQQQHKPQSNLYNYLFNIDVKSPSVKLNLRFPIADLRTNVTHQWWKRQIRDQLLQLHAFDLNFKMKFYLNDLKKQFSINCTQLNGYYQQKSNEPALLFASATQLAQQNIQLLITVSETNMFTGALLTTNMNEQDSLRTVYNINLNDASTLKSADFDPSDCGPFSSTHSRISSEKNRRLINAANKSEMNAFINESKANSEVTIDVCLPNIRFLISDYEFLNDIYNRLVNDILMWEPLAPKSTTKIQVSGLTKSSIGQSMLTNDSSLYYSIYDYTAKMKQQSDKFELCRSSILKNIEDYENEEDEDEEDKKRESEKTVGGDNGNNRDEADEALLRSTPHKLTFILNILNAQIKAYHHYDSSYAEFDLSGNNFKLCVVSGYRLNPNHQYVCLYTEKLGLKHANYDRTSSTFHPSTIQSFEAIFNHSQTNTKLNDLIKSNELATCLFETPSSTNSIDLPMISVAVQVKLYPSAGNKPSTKDVLVALNINDASLIHRFCDEKQFWLFQLIDFINFKDIDICGYVVPIIVTELHLNVTNSSVDYRPMGLNTKALIAFKSLRLSSNVAYMSQSTLLVFNIEDIYLFISNAIQTGNMKLDLKRDYVCVANSDLFELRLLINDKPPPSPPPTSTNSSNNSTPNTTQTQQVSPSKPLTSPILDIKMRCNLIQIRTCVDSCHALIELLSYIGADGDIVYLQQQEQGQLQQQQQQQPQQQQQINKNNNDDDNSTIGSSANSLSEHEEHESLANISSPSLNAEATTNQSLIQHMVNDAMTQSVYGTLPTTFDTKTPDYLHTDDEDDDDDDDEEKSKNSDESDEDSGRHYDYDSPFANLSNLNKPLKTKSSTFPQLSNNNNKKIDANKRNNTLILNENENLNEMDEEEDEDEQLLRDFDIIDMIPGLGEPPRNGEEFAIKQIKREQIQIEANHFNKPLTKIDVLKAPDSYPCPMYSYCIQEISIQWCLYGGSDMSTAVTTANSASNNDDTTSTPSTTPKKSQQAASLSSSPRSTGLQLQLLSEKCLPKQAGGRISTKYDTKTLHWIAKGGRKRNLDVCMELVCHKVKTKIDIYDRDSTSYLYLYRIALAIGDIEIRDKLSTSAFNMFLFRYESETCPKHTNSNMIFLKLLCSRSNDQQHLLECDIKLSVQPLRFNIDQDSIIFLIEYFKNLFSKEITFNSATNSANNSKISNNSVESDTPSTQSPPQSISQQQLLANNESFEQQIYIKNFIFSPDLFIRFDFSGKYDKRPDTKIHTLANVLLTMIQLSNTEIKLKKIYYKRGFLGVDKLLNCLIKEWVTDIQKNQMKNIIKGWGFFNSIIQFFEGFTYLFIYPFEQYKKDGRLLFGIKKGSAAFSTCTILATIELTNRMFQITKNIAEFFYDLVTPHQNVNANQQVLLYNRNIRYRRHPNDIREGIQNAYYVLYEGINDTAANFVNEINTGSEHTGIRGAIGGALRQLPSAALTPIVLTTEATCNILSGIRNQLKPDEKRDDEQKYKSVF